MSDLVGNTEDRFSHVVAHCMSKLTSQVRARDLFSPVTVPGEPLSFWHIISKLFLFRLS